MVSAMQEATGAGTLERELRSAIRGEVRFDRGSRALYATDASNYRQVPIGVVIPRNEDDVVAAFEICRKHSAPIVARGGGTSLAGQACNVAVLFDFSKYMSRLLELNVAERYAVVQPGIVLDALRKEAEKHGLTFGPDPATHDHCTLGGMLGNNSCGVHAVMAGKTSDNVEALEILTYRGERLWVGRGGGLPEQALSANGRSMVQALREFSERHAEQIRQGFPEIPRRVSGYNLDELLPERGFHVARALVGSEGTCVTILRAKLRLVPSPPERVLVVLGYESVFAAADDVPEVMETGPIGLEGLDEQLIRDVTVKHLHPKNAELLPAGQGWLLAEFGGDTADEALHRAEALVERVSNRKNGPSTRILDQPEAAARVWQLRESGLAATANVPGKAPTWPGWEDAAVDPKNLGKYLREFKKLLDRFGYDGDLYGHFGQGCVHTRISFDLSSQQGIEDYKRFLIEAAELVVRFGGSLSGEHGDGQARAELLPLMYGRELTAAFSEFKSIWDPDWKMNPGKVVRPNPVDGQLRVGPGFQPGRFDTEFAFPEDGQSFARVALRCVGVGACRREEGGVMCPSYMVTHEEQHSTRGRARMLFEMLEGEVIRDGWRSEEVRESLDLCLACKGCKNDCPVNVDMASYKAEFLGHYYKHRLRPRAAYSMGLIFIWARMASPFSGAVNFAAKSPLAPLLKKAAGIAPERALPALAPETLTAWYGRRGTRKPLGARVILWPDTFTNFLHPGPGKAAVAVLEHAGFRVELPERQLCCGRPLYDWGMISTARRLWQRTMSTLAREIEEGTPIVGLEPSCVAAFRDELRNLFPNDRRAMRLSEQMLTLSEFIDRFAPEVAGNLEGSEDAVVQAHCHHRSVLGFETEERQLRKLGVRVEAPEQGCCGMAGAFGFEAGTKYEVSMAIGERNLLPRVRELDAGTKVIADGFSCREQIEQATGRRSMHYAEVLAEKLGLSPEPETGRGRSKRTMALAGAAAAACGLGLGTMMLRRGEK